MFFKERSVSTETPVNAYRCPVRYAPTHSHTKYAIKPPEYAAATQFSRFCVVFHENRNTNAAVPAGRAFRSATVLKRCWLFRKAPSTVLPHPKIRSGAQNRNRVVVSFCTSTDDFRNNPPAIPGAKNSIRMKTPNPTLSNKIRRLFVKRWYSVRVISCSLETKTGTRLNLAPSRTTVSTNSTTVSAAVSASAVSLKPKRFGINRTRTRRLNPIPARVITITQNVFLTMSPWTALHFITSRFPVNFRLGLCICTYFKTGIRPVFSLLNTSQVGDE